ncbi:MAG: hypothetical protein E7348_05050 [Clostridiales bacterium]|nr:hypothetical protein [Clostridiales bacterium]
MRIDNNYWLLTKPVAHRGLWGEEIIENSLLAYKNAAEHGYPIEIDLYSSSDGELFSFHDYTLDRMTGEKGNIFDKTAKELKELYLLDKDGRKTDQKIPTFQEVLEIAKGKVPLLIEIKSQPDKKVVDKVVKILNSYSGEFAIQSFDPRQIIRLKRLAPHFIRGILATKIHSKPLPFIKRMVVSRMVLNCIIKPDFISCSFQDLPLKKSKTKNIPVIAWTITNQADYDKIKPFAKNIIFEKFIPKK